MSKSLGASSKARHSSAIARRKDRISEDQKPYHFTGQNAKSERLGTVYDGRVNLGSIESTDGCYRAIDPNGISLGDFPTLKAAMAAVAGESRL